MLLSIVIPAYNEIEFIDEILRRVKETPYEKEIIVVDDCSTDGIKAFSTINKFNVLDERQWVIGVR